MIYRKWNYKTHSYDDYNIKKRLVLLTDDMDELVPCCQCLKMVKYGETYTSLEVHNRSGLGYPVCSKCYAKERERRDKYEKTRRNKE